MTDFPNNPALNDTFTAMDTQWSKQTTALTVTGSIGARLANASTVATTGQQITAALG